MVKYPKPNRFEVYLINLDPTIGSEIQKMRPCVIISPNQINYNINTVIIAPMTTATKDYPTRVAVVFNNKNGQVVLDQIRTVDKTRLIRKEGELTEECAIQVLNVLTEMFIL